MRLSRLLTCCLAIPVLTLWMMSSRGAPGAITGRCVTVVQVDPQHPGTLLAGTDTGLLFRTRDAANSWTPLRFPAALRATLHAVLIDPIEPHTYLVALSSETPIYAGVFRSADEGATWQPVSDLSRKQVWSLTSWAAGGWVMAAGTQDGVYITRDGGASWTHAGPVSTGPRPVVSLAFDPANSDVLYAGTPHLAWKTTDGGKTWRPIHKGMEEDSDIFSIDIDVLNPSRVLAGTCGGIYTSRDGGLNWANLAGSAVTTSRTYVVTRAPRRDRVVFAGTSAGLLQSPDAGATWHRLSRRPVRSIAFDPDRAGRMFVATDQGILRSEDSGLHFTDASQGLSDRSLAGTVQDAPGAAAMEADQNGR
jgi:photosystem II stability/assembly factor-like uncharacterized protein